MKLSGTSRSLRLNEGHDRLHGKEFHHRGIEGIGRFLWLARGEIGDAKVRRLHGRHHAGNGGRDNESTGEAEPITSQSIAEIGKRHVARAKSLGMVGRLCQTPDFHQIAVSQRRPTDQSINPQFKICNCLLPSELPISRISNLEPFMSRRPPDDGLMTSGIARRVRGPVQP